MKLFLAAVITVCSISTMALASNRDTRDADGYPKDFRRPLTQEPIRLGR